MTDHAPFEFFESDDRALTASWIELRRRSFRQHYPWLPEEFGLEDETDRASCRVYAVRGEKVIAGARLTVSAPRSPRILPLEESGLRLLPRAEFAEMDLERNPYAEISRMAVDPECTSGLEVSFGLSRELCRSAARRGVDAIFSICPDGPARLNRVNAKKCGVSFHRYYQVPTIFGVSMWLCAFTGVLWAHGQRIREVAA